MSWTLAIHTLGRPARMDPKVADDPFEHGLRANEIDGSPDWSNLAYIPAVSPYHPALFPAITVGFTLQIQGPGHDVPHGDQKQDHQVPPRRKSRACYWKSRNSHEMRCSKYAEDARNGWCRGWIIWKLVYSLHDGQGDLETTPKSSPARLGWLACGSSYSGQRHAQLLQLSVGLRTYDVCKCVYSGGIVFWLSSA